MPQEEVARKMGRIIAKAWADETFKQRLLADASAVLKEEGVAMPAGLTVKAVENSDKLYNLVIPVRPTVKELDEVELDSVAGGTKYNALCTAGADVTNIFCGETCPKEKY